MKTYRTTTCVVICFIVIACGAQFHVVLGHGGLRSTATNINTTQLDTLSVDTHVVRRLARGDGDEEGDDALNVAASLVSNKVPRCLRRAVAVMCRHMVAPIEQCLSNPKYVQRFIHYDAHTSSAEKQWQKRVHRAGRGVKVDISAKPYEKSGFIAARPSGFDVTDPAHWMSCFGNSQGVAGLRSVGAFQKLRPMSARLSIAMAYLMMQPGSTFRVGTTDGNLPSTSYKHANVVGGSAKNVAFWSGDSLFPEFERVGFELHKYEWFDSSGEFHGSDDRRASDSSYGRAPKSLTSKSMPSPSDGSLYFDAVKPDDCPVWKVGNKVPDHIMKLKRKFKLG